MLEGEFPTSPVRRDLRIKVKFKKMHYIWHGFIPVLPNMVLSTYWVCYIIIIILLLVYFKYNLKCLFHFSIKWVNFMN